MSQKVIFSIILSPLHPNFIDLYQNLNIKNVQFNSMRKALSHLKKEPPDFVVADFLFGYGSNYAGVNVSNLDVFLHSLQKYSPRAKVIVLVEKEEFKYIEKLEKLFTLHAVLKYPVSEKQMSEQLD